MVNQTDLPSGAELYFRHPLYAPIDLTGLAEEERTEYLESVESPRDTIDGYCTECVRESVFAPSEYPDRLRVYQTAQELLNDLSYRFKTQEGPIHRPRGRGESACPTRFFPVMFDCTRNRDHKAVFVFRSTPQSLTKIGQHPSIADVVFPQLRRYKKVLGEGKLGELHRGVRLASHGVGIGCFVYLRRVFEYLVEKAHQAAAHEENWDTESEKSYSAARMDEKILQLHEYLPSLLVQNAGIYSILSKGIHQLDEDECKEYFPTLRRGIEMILDEELEKLRRQQHEKELKNEIGQIRGRIRSGSQSEGA